MLGSVGISAQTGFAQQSPIAADPCQIMRVVGVKAAGYDSTDVPANTLDKSVKTMWSKYGIGSSIGFDLGEIRNICYLDIDWYRGNYRVYDFSISVSSTSATDGKSYVDIFNGKSSGKDELFEKVDIPDVSGRYIRINVDRNTENNWASITEVVISGRTNEPITQASPVPIPTSTPMASAPDPCQFMRVDGVMATGSSNLWSDRDHVPANTLDKSVKTRWSGFGSSSSISFDLGGSRNICYLDIDWYRGNYRVYDFSISVSQDGKSYVDIFNGKSSGKDELFEKVDFIDVSGRYLKINVGRNTENNWASITEVVISGRTNEPITQASPVPIPTSTPMLDTTTPTLSVNSPLNKQSFSAGTTAVTVGGTASDNIGVTQVEVSLNNGPYTMATGTSPWSATVSGLQNGQTYFIKARAKDATNNLSTIATVIINVGNPQQCQTGSHLANGQCVPDASPIVADFIVTSDGSMYYTKNVHTGAFAYGGTSASTAIQTAFNGLTSGRNVKEKVLLQGTFTITNKISIPSYTILEIQGSVKLAPGTAKNMIDASGKQFIEIRGGVLDGNRANQVPATSLIFANQGGIFANPLSDSIISGVEVKDTLGQGIFVRDGKHNIFENNHVHHNGGWGIIVDFAYTGPWKTTSYDQNILGNNVHHNGNHGIAVASGWVTVSGNTLSKNGNNDIDIETEDHDAYAVIKNNKITNSIAPINVYRSPHVTIESNEITGTTSHGITITSVNYITIKNNVLKSIGTSGILFVGASNSNIEGNLVDGFGASGTGLPAGILITNVPGYDAPSSHNTIKDNEAKNGKGYGIRINDNSANNDVTGNSASNNSVGQVSIFDPKEQRIVANNRVA